MGNSTGKVARSVFLCLIQAVGLGWLILGFGNPTVAAELASQTHSGFTNATGAADSFAPTLNGDGRYVVFLSAAPNLVSNDINATLQVFIRDRVVGQTRLVSATTGWKGGNAPSFAPSVSSNGQWVVFQSLATNLVAGATNQWENIFSRDMAAETNALVSINRFGNGTGNNMSFNPQLTPDGRFVVFESFATNLVVNDTNNLADIFVRDLVTGQTTRASVPDPNATTTGSLATRPALTPDARFVVFDSTAQNLVTNDLNTTSDVFVRDRWNETNLLVSVTASGIAGGSSQRASISDDGRYVAFDSVAKLADNDVDFQPYNQDVYLRDLQAPTNRLVSVLAVTSLTGHPQQPVVSRDGQLVVFHMFPITGWSSPVAPQQIYAWDANTGTNRLISVAPDGTTPGNGSSHSPIISADNRYITFLSNSTNLVAGTTNGQHQIYQRDLQTGTTILVSVNLFGHGNDLDCHGVSASDDGQLVAFASLGGNFTPHDHNGAYDVFVRDLAAGTTELISQPDANPASATPFGPSSVQPGAVSADGRYVAFTSLADNLVTNDFNATFDVFVRDLLNGTNTLVSVSTDGTSGNDDSRFPVLSADGRFVAFISRATNLTANVTAATHQIYLRDLQLATTTLVTINTNGFGSAGQPANLVISSNGQWVAYQSTASDLAPADANGQSDVFVFDRAAGTNLVVSLNSSGTSTGFGASRNPVIAPDGQTIIFISTATNLVAGTAVSGTNVYARDILTQTTRRISTNTPAGPCSFTANGPVFSADSRYATFMQRTNVIIHDLVTGTNLVWVGRFENPSLSANGRFVAVERLPFYTGSLLVTNRDIAILDTQLGTELLASRNLSTTAGGNGASRSPVFSADGRYVVFKSQAGNLVANDTNSFTDIFVRDLFLGQTWLLSLNGAGTAGGNLLAGNPVLGADGRTVVFESFAANLTATDFNATKDVFLLRLGLGDSDHDGMDDDWEMTYFSTWSRDGTEDYDHDGLSDLAEFKAGTNPDNDASILRALHVTSFLGGNKTVFWQAVPGRNYQVQFKNEMTDPAWSNVPGAVVATSTTASKPDNTAGSSPNRFYRILLLTP